MKEKIQKEFIYNKKKGDWITIQKPGILRKLSVPRLGPYNVLM